MLARSSIQILGSQQRWYLPLEAFLEIHGGTFCFALRIIGDAPSIMMEQSRQTQNGSLVFSFQISQYICISGQFVYNYLSLTLNATLHRDTEFTGTVLRCTECSGKKPTKNQNSKNKATDFVLLKILVRVIWQFEEPCQQLPYYHRLEQPTRQTCWSASLDITENCNKRDLSFLYLKRQKLEFSLIIYHYSNSCYKIGN